MKKLTFIFAAIAIVSLSSCTFGVDSEIQPTISINEEPVAQDRNYAFQITSDIESRPISQNQAQEITDGTISPASEPITRNQNNAIRMTSGVDKRTISQNQSEFPVTPEEEIQKDRQD